MNSLIPRYTSPKRFSDKAKLKADVLASLRLSKIHRHGRRCQIGAPVCTRIEQGLHHLRKRSQGGGDTDENTVLACRACNRWVERFPKEAAKLGMSHRKGSPDDA